MRTIVAMALILGPFLPAPACRMMEVSDAKSALEARLTPLLGKPKPEVLMAVGAPQEQRTIGGMEVWNYVQSFGMRSNQSAFANAQGNANTRAYAYPGGASANTNYSGYASVFGNGQTWESFDRFTLYFDAGGVLVKWDGYVQR